MTLENKEQECNQAMKSLAQAVDRLNKAWHDANRLGVESKYFLQYWLAFQVNAKELPKLIDRTNEAYEKVRHERDLLEIAELDWRDLIKRVEALEKRNNAEGDSGQ